MKLILVILKRNESDILTADRDTLMIVISKTVLEKGLKDREEFSAILAELNALLKFKELSFLEKKQSGKGWAPVWKFK